MTCLGTHFFFYQSRTEPVINSISEHLEARRLAHLPSDGTPRALFSALEAFVGLPHVLLSVGQSYNYDICLIYLDTHSQSSASPILKKSKNSLVEWFASNEKKFFWNGIHDLPERWAKCVESN